MIWFLAPDWLEKEDLLRFGWLSNALLDLQSSLDNCNDCLTRLGHRLPRTSPFQRHPFVEPFGESPMPSSFVYGPSDLEFECEISINFFTTPDLSSRTHHYCVHQRGGESPRWATITLSLGNFWISIWNFQSLSATKLARIIRESWVFVTRYTMHSFVLL